MSYIANGRTTWDITSSLQKQKQAQKPPPQPQVQKHLPPSEPQPAAPQQQQQGGSDDGGMTYEEMNELAKEQAGTIVHGEGGTTDYAPGIDSAVEDMPDWAKEYLQ